ncbi:MAG: exodeoxyribonuclease VII small subunit [Clostridia bacterium]|nr:exodeoxyribonuclease VII small subunit [Clostridia bacterium]
MNKDQINNMKFEEALRRLEEIVRVLESGQTPLDSSLELYEEAVALVKVCNARLDNAEQKVTMLNSLDISEGN